MKIRIAPLALVCMITLVISSCNQQEVKVEPESVSPKTETVAVQPQAVSDKNVIIGEWTRTDASYQLKISSLSDDGSMKAEYFNPRPINVSKSTWELSAGLLKIYVELRDQNYPGSNYALTYYPERDSLGGTYFQAVERVTYNVGFIKNK